MPGNSLEECIVKETHSLKEKYKQFIIILIPILVTQIGIYSMNFFDTMMSGRYSSKDLAGVAIGSSIWVPIYAGLGGILLSITPITAQFLGARNAKEVSSTIIQGVYIAIALGLFVIILGSFALDPILNGMNLDNRVQKVAEKYLIALSFGIIPLFVYYVFRCFIDALGKTKVSMLITLLALPINVLFNYLFIYGKGGFPALGGVGSGYATAVTYWFLTFIAALIIHKQPPFSKYNIFRRLPSISFSKWKEFCKIGLPIGLSIFFESSIFSVVTLMMSEYSSATIAAHQAANNFASLLFMIPLSISMTLTIVVGFEVGADRFQDAEQYSRLGIFTAVALSIVTGVSLFFFRDKIAMLYSHEPLVIQQTAQFLAFAAFFQLSDAIQAPVQGALRGYKDVNLSFIMSLISYWIIGLPFGFLLAKTTRLQAYGYWVGLITGLAFGAVTLFTRLVYVQKKKYPSHIKWQRSRS
jgi:MATE family multidrug resistance protein